MMKPFLILGTMIASIVAFRLLFPAETTPVTKEPSIVSDLSLVKNEAAIATSAPTTLPSEEVTNPVPKELSSVSEPTLPSYTKETLLLYNGQNLDLPIYIALEGDVYDVTAGRKFYAPGGAYHFLAGTDGTILLRTFGADLIRKKYPIVGKYMD